MKTKITPKNTRVVLYENIQCLSPDGEHMFYCTAKLARSYIRKGLADIISEEPFVFQLKFQPAGKGDPGMKPKSNNCECCNTIENLSKHHVVPYEYRKWFSIELKSHKSDKHVVPLCRKCHDEYEIEAANVRYILNFIIAEHIEKLKIQDTAKRAKRTLANKGDKLPPKKIGELIQKMKACNFIDEKLPCRAEQTVIQIGTDKLTEMWMYHYEKWLARNRTIKRRKKK